MKKKLLKIVVGSLFVVGTSGMTAQAIPTVNLNVLDSDIYVGESFDVQVWVDGDGIGPGLLSFGFDINTTGSAFTYDGYLVASGFDDDGSLVPPEIAGSAFPAVIEDNWLLATLSFTAMEAGTGVLQTLGITGNLFYGLAYEIEPFTIGWYDINASLEVTINSGPISPVPEPATMLLLGTGLTCCVGSGIRRKKK